jgi:hypothetical protein
VADVLTLNVISIATGMDDGPQDGVFDSFTTANLGSVNNNGFTSFRTAFKFNLSGLPAGWTIDSATVTMVMTNAEGTREIQVHGYTGGGNVELTDFARDGLLESASVNPSTSETLVFDVTSFVADRVANGEMVVGFNVREEPPNTSNFQIMQLEGIPVLPILSITVNAPTTAQPATGLYASSIVGNRVTLRWSPPALGPAPTQYVLDAGVTPTGVLASLPTGSAAPIFSVTAPTGIFYLRAYTVVGATRSVAGSNQIRIAVNVPEPPSPPVGLVGLTNGSSLALTWRNTFAGGDVASTVLDVSGALAGSLVLGPTDHFSVAGVPPGTYTLRVRAFNDTGSSAPSNAVTLTFPGACSVPLPPDNFLAYAVGNTITVLWDPSASGAAATGYVVHVSGAYAGGFPTAGRSLSGTVIPGTYGLRVSATNPCGSSPPTAIQIVTIP